MTFDDQDRAARFEERRFWPTHGRSSQRPEGTVVHASDRPAAPYDEWSARRR